MKEFPLSILREANLKRIPQFRDRLGNIAHSHPQGKCWSPDRWMNAVTGEVGEVAGELKKAARGDYGSLAKYAMDHNVDQMPADVKQKIAYEMADVVCYLDLLAIQFGIDLGQAIKDKFNVVSDRVKATIYIIEFSDGTFVVSDDAEIPF